MVCFPYKLTDIIIPFLNLTVGVSRKNLGVIRGFPAELPSTFGAGGVRVTGLPQMVQFTPASTDVVGQCQAILQAIG
jgi:hypothetical protein